MKPITELTNEELLDCFIYAVQWWHYSPGDEPDPKYSRDALREEIEKRLNKHAE